MNRRDEQIAALRERTQRLRSDRLIEFERLIREGYESESVVENIARVVEERNRTPSDFRVLTNSEARRIGHFNDDSYYWGMYCTQLGRSVAHGEERYIFQELQAVPDSGLSVSASNPSFEKLASAVDLLRSRGFNPDTLCAPIALFVPFAGERHNISINWNATPKEALLTNGAGLKLFWSSGAAPLDKFVVLDSSRMTWRFKVDAQTGGRLTVAIGESTIATGERAVVFLAETVAKFEVDRNAAMAVALDGEPLDPDEYVRQEQLR